MSTDQIMFIHANEACHSETQMAILLEAVPAWNDNRSNIKAAAVIAGTYGIIWC